jgi:hypothetical protein
MTTTNDGASDASDASYQERLGQTLRRRDPAALRSFLVAQAQTFGDERQVHAIEAQSDAELEVIMHRMILARTDLADMHPASRSALGMDPAQPKRSSPSQRRRR